MKSSSKIQSKVFLAIVIPYYKVTYFEEVLNALSRQTNLNFNVYIGDDASLNSPMEIISKYHEKLNIFYTRFETNLGNISLTQQWNRTVLLNDGEEWLWVLPDDDVPSPYCVEAFYEALNNVEKFAITVFRMPLEFINAEGKILFKSQDNNPIVEDNLAFYYRLLKGETSSSLGDNIFHRQSFEDSGGFINLPKAWGADHAMVLKVSSGNGIYFMKDALLSFRMSGENISSNRFDGLIKIKSRIAFAQWLKMNESIFPLKPDKEFYDAFYWKGEYYVLYEWNFSFLLFYDLYQLRRICFNSNNLLPILKIFFQKLQTIFLS